MDAYILAKTVVFIFLSINNPTTLYFDEPVEFVQAGKSGDLSIVRSSNKKILVVQPLIKNEEVRNMVVITKNNHYNFNFKIVDHQHHGFVYVYPGKVNRSYRNKFENNLVRVMEGDTSIYVINKTDNSIDINGIKMDRTIHYSKGLPVFINNQRVLY